MKEGRDFSIVNKINAHFNDLSEDLKVINSFEDFINNKERRRAVLFDFLQIGELTNQLSKKFKTDFNNKNAFRLIAIRNRIVHGYSTIRDDIIYNTLKNQLSVFIDEVNNFSRRYYSEQLKKLVGKKVKVLIDRPIGYKHEGITYSLNYGYIENITALDGEFQDAYIIDAEEPLNEYVGVVLGIIKREEDIEDKLIVAKSDIEITDQEIERKVLFVEQYFKHHIEK